MKYFVIYLTFLVGIFASHTNCLGQQLISTLGGDYADQEFALSWSIGEPLTATLSDEEYVITQGFQQPKLNVTGIYEHQNFENAFSIYPNPVNSTLTLTNKNFNTGFRVTVFDNKGGKIYIGTFPANTAKQNISFDSFQPGVYHLRIMSLNGTLLKRTKIVKI